MSLATLSPEFASLQLGLADRFVQLQGGSYSAAVEQLTNLQRRLGLGSLTEQPNRRWTALLEQLSVAATHDERVNLVMDMAATLPAPVPEHVLRGWPTVGAFSVQVSGRVARTHFFSFDDDGRSPLHPAKLELRRHELRSVLSAAYFAEPSIERVEGGSWLYTTQSYASLFPEEHIRNAVVRRGRWSFPGMSHWGQFVDHTGAIRANLADEFRTRVATWVGGDLCALFPLPTLEVSSPIEVFDLVR